ncbi:MAG: nuclear transport factor 2 family protein [Anaerolineae bacterium]|nr:nuclear transport factor 2 family protein [Anaerolineae bacterium]
MEDTEAIKRCALNYVEGWYEGEAGKMRQALSPHLAKRRIVSDEEIWEVNRDWMVAATGEGRGRLDTPESGRKEVTILDRTETMASVKIVSEKFVDYIHLAKSQSGWMIVNVLWDYIPQ